MQQRIAGFLFLGLIAAALAPALVAQSARPASPPDLVDDLDYVFQERFRSTEGNVFGISRIPVTPEHRRVVHWKPDQKLEKDVALRLAERGLAGAFLLAKPAAAKLPLSEQPTENAAQLLNQVPNGRGALSRPILLSEGDAPRPLPTTQEILKGVKGSFAAFEKTSRHEFGVREWSILARPIRATSDCLDCHRKWTGDQTLAEGSVLGVAMYAFTLAAPNQAPKP